VVRKTHNSSRRQRAGALGGKHLCAGLHFKCQLGHARAHRARARRAQLSIETNSQAGPAQWLEPVADEVYNILP